MAQAEGLDKLLSEHPFFRDMDTKVRGIVAGCAKNEVFEAGQYVFNEGGQADKFYILRHGSIAIEVDVPSREPLILETVNDGEIFGWSWIVPPYRRTFDARTLELCRIVSLDAKCLRGKMEKDHSLGYEFYKRFIPVMAERLGAARLQLLDLYGNPRA